MVYLTRKVEFAASHRYHNPAFSAEENRRDFGVVPARFGIDLLTLAEAIRRIKT